MAMVAFILSWWIEFVFQLCITFFLWNTNVTNNTSNYTSLKPYGCAPRSSLRHKMTSSQLCNTGKFVLQTPNYCNNYALLFAASITGNSTSVALCWTYTLVCFMQKEHNDLLSRFILHCSLTLVSKTCTSRIYIQHFYRSHKYFMTCWEFTFPSGGRIRENAE